MHKARGRGRKKNPRPKPRTALPKTDPLEANWPRTGMLEAKDQGHNAEVIQKTGFCSLQNFVNFPETLSVLQKKNVFKNFFASSLVFFKTKQNWSLAWSIFNKSKNSVVLNPRTGHFSRTCRLRGQGQELQIVSLRTPPLIKITL